MESKLKEKARSPVPHSSHHIVPPRTYILVLLGLMFLMAATVAVAEFDFGGPFNLIIALAIAICKMILIILFFMHVKYSSGLTWLFVGSSLFFLLILFTLTLCDYLSREWWSPFVQAPY